MNRKKIASALISFNEKTAHGGKSEAMPPPAPPSNADAKALTKRIDKALSAIIPKAVHPNKKECTVTCVTRESSCHDDCDT